MARMTLLEMVQSILSDLDADEVNSINATVDSDRVVSIIRDVYYDITTNRTIPELMRMIKLFGLSDNNYPNYLEIPEGVSNIKWFQYNIAEFALDEPAEYRFREIQWLDPESFLHRINRREYDAANVQIVKERISGSELIVINDKQPEYFTTFDDKYVVCDSWDAAVEDTLQEYKTRVWGKYVPPFEKVDTFYPVADSNLFPYLLAEAKSRAISLMRGQPDMKIEQAARRHKAYFQNDKYNFELAPQRPKYGR